MYDINFAHLFYCGIFFGVLVSLLAWGVWELASALIDITITLK